MSFQSGIFHKGVHLVHCYSCMNDLPLKIPVSAIYADDTYSGSNPSLVAASMDKQMQLIHN